MVRSLVGSFIGWFNVVKGNIEFEVEGCGCGSRLADRFGEKDGWQGFSRFIGRAGVGGSRRASWDVTRGLVEDTGRSMYRLVRASG